MTTFSHIEAIEELNTFIQQNNVALVYISREQCSICHSLLPQIEAIMERYPKISTAHVSADTIPEVAGAFSIFTVPVVLVFVEGKEYYRGARIVPLEPFEAKIKQLSDGYFL
ncbi:Thioredoxin [Paraliobacillus sp. PM-2]|uniref:thioredoxin family protein n=1 Tax=Paraliobacillus sp. PM-2 TaxID=1462524 RepID=UPI00061C2B03|nr:thioredoxin family protein [Paraliobacillus sp. PM-2]CQR47937.1 Thioredoxin [Paraliobacillus sp. PM-2]